VWCECGSFVGMFDLIVFFEEFFVVVCVCVVDFEVIVCDYLDLLCELVD
jgi:hypothetical protein